MGPQEHRWLGTGWSYATVPSCVAPSLNHLDALAKVVVGYALSSDLGPFSQRRGRGRINRRSNRPNSKSDQSHNGHISGKVLGICPRIVVAKHSHRRLLALFIRLQARE